MRRTVISILAGGVIAVVAGASPAGAAMTIGETAVPNATCSGPVGTTWIQAVFPALPEVQYSAPTPGVITSWSHQTGNQTVPRGLKLKVVRVTTFPSFRTVGQSRIENVDVNKLNVYKTRISVQAGDVIGLSVDDTFFECGFVKPGGYQFGGVGSDPPVGTEVAYGVFAPSNAVDVSAQLEPDADNDGFGDETQDLCPTNASTQGVCPAPQGATPDTTPPETTITKAPPKKTTKKKATFEFSSSEAGSTFDCSLDGGAFAACTSPKSFKVKEGKHKVSVRAKDAAGNFDPTPATASWKFKKPA